MKKFKGITIFLLIVLAIFSFSFLKHYEEPLTVEAQKTNDRMLKAAWVSPFVSDVSGITTEATFKSRLNSVLDNLESYGYNALIFHIRIHNNALYPSNLNPKSPYVSNINFNTFDPLAWLVEETHKRGMEFHAWMNPYRSAEGRYSGTMPSTNPESNNANMLVGTDGKKILDPSKYVVKAHIANTVKEVIENYDVDAIHFDDYFYVPYNGLTDAQKTAHVNDMVEMVSNTIKTHNENNNKYVQFGISPTGVYKNGNGAVHFSNGRVVSSGSQTTAQQHGNSYINADTLHWLNEGWLDYIMPQIYWSRNLTAAPFLTVLNWWDQVASYLDVNLYIGLGLYKSDVAGETWGNDSYELSAQLTLIENANIANGYSIYSYQNMLSGNSFTQVNNAYNVTRPDRKNISVLPEIKNMTPVVPNNVSVNHANGRLIWDGSSDAKFYYLYRSTGELTYSDSEIFKVVDKNTFSYVTDDYSNTYNYGVKVLSGTNHLSGQSVEDPVNTSYAITYNLDGGVFSGYGTKEEITLAFLTDLYTYVGPTDSLNTFIHGAGNTSGFNGTWYSNETYRNKIYGANIKTGNDNYFLSHSVYGLKWKPLATFMENFVRVGNPNQDFWSSPYTGLIRLNQYLTNVSPGGAWGPEELTKIPEGLSQTVLYAYDRNTPTIELPKPDKQNNTFLGWYTNPSFTGSPVTQIPKGSTGDKVFYAKWEDNSPKVYFTVSFNLGYNGLTLPSVQVEQNKTINEPSNPVRTGYTFIGWYEGSTLYDFGKQITKDTTLTANWQQNEVPIVYYNVSFNLGYNGLTLPSQTIKEGNKISKPADPVREGYSFNGWLLNGNIYNFNNPVNQNLNLTANWILDEEIEEVTIFLDYGYNNNTTQIKVELGTKLTKPVDPVRAGYTFIGWYLGNVLYDFNSTVSYGFYLEAKWEEDSIPLDLVTVTFDYGYNNITQQVEVERGHKVSVPNNPTRSGYDFAGWTLGSANFDFNTEINYNIVITAKWTERVTTEDYVEVIFDHNYDNIKVSIDVLRGEALAKPADPVRSGYIFKGWYFINEPYNFNSLVNYSITIIARWEQEKAPVETVKVIFDYGYNNETNSVNINLGSKLTKPEDPVRVGYTFIGWYLGNDLYNFNNNVNFSLYLFARWEKDAISPSLVEVIFDYNYNDEIKNVYITDNTKLEKPEDPVRVGYIFKGWYLGDNLFNFNTNITFSITLTAKWEEEIIDTTFTVTFDYNYNNESNEIKVSLNEKVTMPENPVRVGYIFKGWYLENSIYDFNSEVTKDLTLTAKWEEEVSLVTVNFNLGYDSKYLDSIKIEIGSKVNIPYTPHRDGYLFIGWHLSNDKYDFNNIVNHSVELIAKWEKLESLNNVSIYGKSTTKTNSDRSKSLVFYGIKNLNVKSTEHGFYLVYGTTNHNELLEAVNNNKLINNKKVLKVKVEGFITEGIYSVNIKGIPSAHYEDVITAIPYVVVNGSIIFSVEGFISSVTYANMEENTVLYKVEALISNLKRRSFYNEF